ncbi:MAG: YeeE/YedE thiosulfate transporter family protein [Planctomycetota bacterium]|jgi:hypothetical protein
MNELNAQTHPLPWWAAGILLGLVQVLAVSLVGPLDVSDQFVVADARTLEHLAPEYAENHPLISNEEYKKFGYGWWFGIGIALGALLAALHLRTWKVRATAVWWRRNHDAPALLRLIAGFCGGFFVLLGAGLAHGGTTGQFVSGWTQLSLSAVPFTVTMFGFGMLVAYLVYPKTPDKYRRAQ